MFVKTTTHGRWHCLFVYMTFVYRLSSLITATPSCFSLVPLQFTFCLAVELLWILSSKGQRSVMSVGFPTYCICLRTHLHFAPSKQEINLSPLLPVEESQSLICRSTFGRHTVQRPCYRPDERAPMWAQPGEKRCHPNSINFDKVNLFTPSSPGASV